MFRQARGNAVGMLRGRPGATAGIVLRTGGLIHKPRALQDDGAASPSISFGGADGRRVA